MAAQQMIVDTIANNLANMNTNGFKKSQVDFQDLMYMKLLEPGAEISAGFRTPTGFEIGAGVRPASTTKVFTQGDMTTTGQALDVAIEGGGFFQVTMPDGTTRYTRDGALRIDAASGQLCTVSGYFLEPSVTIPDNWRTINIGNDGTVSVLAGGDQTPQNVGQLTLVRFANPSGLSSQGGNLYTETDASGSAASGTPGAEGLGTLRQGFLEKSNVQMITELVSLITAQRAYETNSKAIKTGDEMLQTATRLVRG
jgi:flagellar basal-body rod protein FlgG